MKKKSIMIIVVSALVCITIAALLIFVFSGESNDNVKTIELNGTWKVVAHFTNETPQLSENEYVTFTDDRAVARKDGATIADSAYTLTGGRKLELSDISRQYTLERRTDNYIRLYETESTYMDLVRYPNDDLSVSPIDKSKLYYKWKVAYRNTAELIVNEIIAFAEDKIEDYRNNSVDPVAVSNYTWSQSDCIFAETWKVEYRLILFSDDVIFFVETQSGFVWELNRII